MLQIKEMTKEEKIEMYKKVDKSQLIEMLIEANNQLERLTNEIKPYNVEQKENLESLNNKEFTPHEMNILMFEYDMFHTEDDDDVSVSLTNYKTGAPFKDCGKFYWNKENGTYTFKLYDL